MKNYEEVFQFPAPSETPLDEQIFKIKNKIQDAAQCLIAIKYCPSNIKKFHRNSMDFLEDATYSLDKADIALTEFLKVILWLH